MFTMEGKGVMQKPLRKENKTAVIEERTNYNDWVEKKSMSMRKIKQLKGDTHARKKC